MQKNIIQFSDKELKDTITFSSFEKRFEQHPIFLYSELKISVDGFEKKDNIKIELLDFKILNEQLKKLNINELKQISFCNIDETLGILIQRINNDVKISGHINNFSHTVKLNFEFDSDLSIINIVSEQIEYILNRI